jgi:hypothetical protein
MRCKLRKLGWPCVIRGKVCNVSEGTAQTPTQLVECTECLGWVHEKCTPVSIEEFDSFAKSYIYFYYLRCVCDDGGNYYDYGKSLNRLEC